MWNIYSIWLSSHHDGIITPLYALSSLKNKKNTFWSKHNLFGPHLRARTHFLWQPLSFIYRWPSCVITGLKHGMLRDAPEEAWRMSYWQKSGSTSATRWPFSLTRRWNWQAGIWTIRHWEIQYINISHQTFLFHSWISIYSYTCRIVDYMVTLYCCNTLGLGPDEGFSL